MNPPPKRKLNIFCRIMLPFCIGIWVLRSTHFAEYYSVCLISAIIIFILLFIINYLYRSLKVYHYKWILGLWINIFLFLCGMCCCSAYDNRTDFQYFLKHPATYFKISVDSEPVLQGRFLKFKAQVLASYFHGKRQPATGSLMVTLHLDTASFFSLQYGDVCMLPAKYQDLQPPKNPAEFDIASWLSNQNIHHQAFFSSQEIALLSCKKGNPVIRFSMALRKRQVELYQQLIKDKEAFAVAATLILGYRSDLDAETLAAYSKTGTIHALSVSGMHVGIIYLVLEWALKWMNKKRVLLWGKTIIILVLIWGYALLTGYSASVLRSAIMLSLYIISRVIGKDAGGYHILCLSACCLLLYNPFLLWDVGFQLSYMAVFGLLYLQPILEELFSFQQIWLQKLWSMVCLSLAAQIMTFPFSVYYFHQFPVYFIISNLFIAIPVTLLMYSGIAILLFKLYWLAPAFEWLIIFMNKGLEKIAVLPYAVIDGIWLAKTELILLCGCLYFVFSLFSAQKNPGLQGNGAGKKYIYLSLITLLMLQILLMKDKINALNQHRLVVFKIRKQEAIALLKGNQALVITDLRPTDKKFKFHVQPALSQARISKVTYLFKEKTLGFKRQTINFNPENYQIKQVFFPKTPTRNKNE